MKKLFLIFILLSAFTYLKAQYHLLYFSDDSIATLKSEANHLYLQGKCQESIEYYKRLWKIDSLRKSANYGIALNFSKMKEPDSAKFYFSNAMRLGFDSLLIYDRIIFMYEFILDDKEKTYNSICEMIKYWPRKSELYRKRASLGLSWKRDVDGYNNDMQKAIELGDIEAKKEYEWHKKAVEVHKKKLNP